MHLLVTGLRDGHCSGDKIKKNEMSGACSTYGGEERCIQGFDGEPEGKRPLRRPYRRWEDTVQMSRQKLG